MFKAIGNLLYKTPWWVLALTGLFTFLVLALFTVPFNVIRLSDSGKSSTENRAIQREIDRTFGDNALTIAERVVKSMGERTTDPARKAELAKALKEIEGARAELSSAENDAKRAKADSVRAAKEARRAASELEQEQRRQAKETAQEQREKARESAQGDLESAREKIRELQAARKEAAAAQARVGLDDPTAFAAFDKAIAGTQAKERQANDTLKKIKSEKSGVNTGQPVGDEVGKTTPTAPTTPTTPTTPSTADGKTSSAGAEDKSNKVSSIKLKSSNSDKPGDTNDLTITKKGGEDTVNIDGMLGGTRIKGDITIGAPEKSMLQINGIDIGVPTPPLPPEFRDDIRRKVSNDFRRVGIGAALIVAFIPLFIILIIVKIYIGRSRRALAVASEKTQEAEFANVNRQIVEAKLMALQAQVEPHFLYNTLANVQALTEVDPQQANKMTGHLIQYLRATLPKMRENISTVGQEIELVRAYLNILKMRMGARLEFGIEVPAELENLPFPPLMLPSLVENAIKHGLEPQREGGRIDVIAEKVDVAGRPTIRIMVKDTGRGLSDSPIQTGGGIGLANIRARLLALFGDEAKFTLESNTPNGVIATIETPAAGSTAFTADATASPGQAKPAAPRSWSAKTLNVAVRTHNAWAGILVKVFVAIVAVLGVVFLVSMVGLATDMIPLSVGDTRISGLEGMALGTAVFMLVFGILSLVALILVAVIYGLSFLFVGLAIGIPILILVSVFPVLSPFVLVGFAIYWFWWRKRKKSALIDPPVA